MQDKINCFLSDLCLKELSHQTHAVTLNMLYLYKLEYLLLIYLLLQKYINILYGDFFFSFLLCTINNVILS